MWTEPRRALSRRQWLARTGAGFGSTVLAAMLAEEARASTRPPAVTIDPVDPWRPRSAHFPARAKNVIFLYMVGGPSSIDTFDFKPALQASDGMKLPDSISAPLKASKYANVLVGAKDTLMASPWKFRPHGQRGMMVSELMPHVAKHVDDLCFVHSLQADSNNHAPASIQLHTGDIVGGKASLGSWVTYGLGTSNRDLPAYILLFEAGPLGGPTNYSNGFLPAAFQGTHFRGQGLPVADLLPPDAFAPGQRASLDVLRELNLRHRASRPAESELEARIASYELSWRMQSTALDVSKLEDEPEHLRRAYGLEHADPVQAKFARKCLMARRLVERGVRFVQVYDMWEKDGWDAHANLVKNHEIHARVTDQAIGALLEDLKQSGLWEDTLVIWASEFGRTPMEQGERGRQHNAAGFTAWLAGGAVKAGFSHGATDEFGLLAVDQPMPFRDLHATILAALGLQHEQLFFETSGRLERLTGVQNTARVVRELLA